MQTVPGNRNTTDCGHNYISSYCVASGGRPIVHSSIIG